MNKLQSRVKQLEQKHAPKDGGRVVTVYKDKVTPAELEAMRHDKTIGTLIAIEYRNQKPVSEITTGRYSARVGVDLGNL